MKTSKRVTALLMAGLILLSVTACSDPGEGEGTESTSGGGLSVGTNFTDDTTDTEPEEGTTGETSGIPGGPSTDTNINEENPAWTEKACTLVVVAKSVLTIRKDTSVNSDKIAEVADGTMLESDAHSAYWYRVSYKADENSEAVTGYVSKKYVVEHNQALIDSFEECNEEVKIVAEISLNVRRYPDWDEAGAKNDLVCGSLANGTIVTCVAKCVNGNTGWYKVQVKTTKEGQVDMKDGEETREYYISANPKYSQLVSEIETGNETETVDEH